MSKLALTLAAALLATILSSTQARADADSLTVGAVSKLPNLSSRSGLPVHGRAIVLQYDPKAYHLYVRDDQGAVYVAMDNPMWRRINLTPGDRIELVGTTIEGGYSLDVHADQLVVLEKSSGRPKAIPVPLEQVGDDRWNCNLVEVEGEVVSIEDGAILGEHSAMNLKYFVSRAIFSTRLSISK